MPYPREIYLDTETEDRLASYIESELLNHYAERGEHITDLQRYQRDYWAKPTTERATFPFTGAATIIVPLSAIAIEAVHARTMTTMFALPQFVSARAISSDWDIATAPVEKFMDQELLDHMRIRRPMGDCFLEAEKFGTMIGKVGYERLVKTALRTEGEEEQEFDVVIRDGCVFESVPDARFLMPHASMNAQMTAWCGQEHSASPYEVMLMERSELFRPGTIIDQEGSESDVNKEGKLKRYYTVGTGSGMGQEGGPKFDDQQARLENTQPAFPERLDWVEIWLAFDVDKSGIDKEIVVHYHRESKTFMSIRYNWWQDLRRPYRTNVYFPVEHRWRGIGICKKNEQFQKEITTQHRQRLDNATLANMRMIKVSKLSGYGPKEPIFPGKMWFLDDMTHVDSFQLGEIYPSSYSNEQATLLYSQQRTGVNDTILGMPQVGTPGTATSDLARIQEGNKKFDFVYQNFKEFAGEIIMDVAACIQQYGPRRVEYYETAENGQLVKAFFDMPSTLVSEGLLLQLKPTSQQQNKIVDRQNWQQIAVLLTQYYQGLTQLAMPLQNPQLLQAIFTKGLGAATEAMRQILESYDVRNIDRIIVKELEALANGSQTIGPGPGGPQGLIGAGAPAGMDYLTQALSTAGGNGNGTANRVQQPY